MSALWFRCPFCWLGSGVFTINFEQNFHFVLAFPFLISNKKIPTGLFLVVSEAFKEDHIRIKLLITIIGRQQMVNFNETISLEHVRGTATVLLRDDVLEVYSLLYVKMECPFHILIIFYHSIYFWLFLSIFECCVNLVSFQQTFTSSKSSIKTRGKDVKYVQS